MRQMVLGLVLGMVLLGRGLTTAQAKEKSSIDSFLSRLLRPNSTLAPAVPTAPPPNAPTLPDPRLTPGDTLEVSLDDIRTPGYSAKVRNVPVSVKREVYAAYGIARWTKGEYEVDHLIPLSLGGSNSKKNLWPESYLTDPLNAHVKDRLEVRLLKLVRDGTVDLKVAQADIARDWTAAYLKYVGPLPKAGRDREKINRARVAAAASGRLSLLPELGADGQPDLDASGPATPPAPKTPTTGAVLPAASASSSQKVWVNTKSGVFHRAESRYFGKTKEGKFMSEAKAVAAGYRAAPDKE